MTKKITRIDAYIKHYMDVQRFAVTTSKEFASKNIPKVERTYQDVLMSYDNLQSKKQAQELADILAEQVDASYQNQVSNLSTEFETYTKFENQWNKNTIGAIIGQGIQYVAPAAILTSALDHKIGDATISDFWDSIISDNVDVAKKAVMDGWSQGLTNYQILKNILGNEDLNFKDGSFEQIRRSTEYAIRTQTNAISNEAKLNLYAENQDIVKNEMLIAVLDSRTSLICQYYDHKVFPVGVGPRPPFHPNCRTTVIPLFKGETADDLFGRRPAVGAGPDYERGDNVTRTGKPRLPRAGDDRLEVTQVPSKTFYEDFLHRQPLAFQEDVLGVEKAQLFQNNNLSIDDLVQTTKQGYFQRPLTLNELRNKYIPMQAEPGTYVPWGGQGYEFYSPNQETAGNIDNALTRFHSDEMGRLKSIVGDINNQTGSDSLIHAAIGNWANSAEESFAEEIFNAKSLDEVMYNAAWKGKMANQLGVLGFMADAKGQDSLYMLHFKNWNDRIIKNLAKDLNNAGIMERTIVPTSDGMQLMIYSQEGKLKPVIEAFGNEKNFYFQEIKGQGAFLGANTRPQAQKAYTDFIERYEARNPDSARYRPPRNGVYLGPDSAVPKFYQEKLETGGISIPNIVSDKTPRIKAIYESGRYDVNLVKETDSRVYFEYTPKGIDNWDKVTPTLKDPDTGKTFSREPIKFNSAIATPVKIEDKFGTRYKFDLNKGYSNDIPQNDDFMYRGISFEEFENIKRTGKIQSIGSFNLGEDQAGLTYYSSKASQASHYAHGFAPVQFQAVPNKPAYVIAVKKRPGKFVAGTGETEVGIPYAISSKDIVKIWEGDPYAVSLKGETDIIKEFGRISDGSGSAPSISIAWKEIPKITIEETGGINFPLTYSSVWTPENEKELSVFKKALLKRAKTEGKDYYEKSDVVIHGRTITYEMDKGKLTIYLDGEKVTDAELFNKLRMEKKVVTKPLIQKEEIKVKDVALNEWIDTSVNSPQLSKLFKTELKDVRFIEGDITQPVNYAFFSASNNSLNMGTILKDTEYGQAVFRHESGHAIDYALGKTKHRSLKEDYNAAIQLDFDSLKKGKIAADKEFIANPKGRLIGEEIDRSPLVDELINISEDEKVREAWIVQQFTNQGINYNDFLEFLDKHTNVLDLQGIGRQGRIVDALDAYRLGDAQRFTESLLVDWNKNYAGQGKGVLSNFSDLGGATSRNEFFPNEYGFFGHRNDYYDAKRQFGNFENVEAFANLTALFGTKEKFAWQMTEHFFPNQSKKFLSIITEEAGIELKKTIEKGLIPEFKEAIGTIDPRVKRYVSSVDWYKTYAEKVTVEDVIKQFPKEVENKINEIKQELNKLKSTDLLYKIGKNWTPERQILHQKIINNYLNEISIKGATPKGYKKPEFLAFGGRGGSGKSKLIDPVSKGGLGIIDTSKYIYINADDIMESLPGYEKWNAALYHEEAGEIADELLLQSRQLGLNVIFDATMKTGATAVNRIQQFIGSGYNIKGYYMFSPPQQAALRTINRFWTKKHDFSGRYAPAEVVLSNTTNEETFDFLKKYFTEWYFFDSQGISPILVDYEKGHSSNILETLHKLDELHALNEIITQQQTQLLSYQQSQTQ